MNSVQAGLVSAHRRATDSGGHTRAGSQAAKRGPWDAEASPRLAPQRHTRHAHPLARPRLPASPIKTHLAPPVPPTRARAHTPLGPTARTYPATRRAHRGPRTAAASCQTWSRPSGGGSRDTRFKRPAEGWRRPQARAPPDQGRAAGGELGAGGALTAGNGARDASLAAPATSRSGPRRSRASRSCSVVSGPPQSALDCTGCAPPTPVALSNRRGVQTRILRMETGREEGRGLGPSRRATQDRPARGLAVGAPQGRGGR